METEEFNDNPFNAPPEPVVEPPKKLGRPKKVPATMEPLPKQSLPEPMVVKGTGPQPVPSAEPEPEYEIDETEEKLLGVPKSYYSDAEQSYIRIEIAEYMDRMGNQKQAQPYVEEIVKCDIEKRRLDVQTYKVERKYKDFETLSKKLKPINDMRSDLTKRMDAAMEKLGLAEMHVMQDTKNLSLSQLHSRYRKAIQARRLGGNPIGMIDKEAAALADSQGLNSARYRAPALHDEARDQILVKKDSEVPPSE